MEDVGQFLYCTLRLHGRGKVNRELDGRNCGRVAWDKEYREGGGGGGGGGQKAYVEVLGYKGWWTGDARGDLPDWL